MNKEIFREKVLSIARSIMDGRRIFRTEDDFYDDIDLLYDQVRKELLMDSSRPIKVELHVTGIPSEIKILKGDLT